MIWFLVTLQELRSTWFVTSEIHRDKWQNNVFICLWRPCHLPQAPRVWGLCKGESAAVSCRVSCGERWASAGSSHRQRHKAVVLGDVTLQNVWARPQHPLKPGSVQLHTLERATRDHCGRSRPVQQQCNLTWNGRQTVWNTWSFVMTHGWSYAQCIMYNTTVENKLKPLYRITDLQYQSYQWKYIFKTLFSFYFGKLWHLWYYRVWQICRINPQWPGKWTHQSSQRVQVCRPAQVLHCQNAAVAPLPDPTTQKQFVNLSHKSVGYGPTIGLGSQYLQLG